MRVLIIGLDGATFDVLTPMMEEGRMPRLQAAIKTGASGLLRSTAPAITPAAWTTFVTGVEPGVHGILDFESYDALTGELHFNTSRRRPGVRDLWDVLGAAGLKVGSINVPLSFPAKPVNGFLISGFETPGPESDFVYPRELKGDILARWPDPTLRARWQSSLLSPTRAFQDNLRYVCASFHQGADMTVHLGDRYGWDALMVVLKLVDNLQHKTWKYLDPRWPKRSPARRDACKRCFEELDLAIGKLLDYAERAGAAVMMVSDHGHGSLEGKVHPNHFLRRWGYLVLRPPLSRFLGRNGRAHGRGTEHGIERHLAVDLARTRACVMHADNNAFLYINLKGRQPTGIVDPSDYEALRDELKARFQSGECTVRTPAGVRIPLFPEIEKPEQLYGVRREDQPWLPDLMLTPDVSLSVVRRLRGRNAVRWLSYRKLEGTHRPEGIFIAAGPGIKHHPNVRAKIIDCAPTVLTMLGIPVPRAMTGRVISEIFQHAPKALLEDQAHPAVTEAPVHPARTEQVYSEDELQEVKARLRELGYLE